MFAPFGWAERGSHCRGGVFSEGREAGREGEERGAILLTRRSLARRRKFKGMKDEGAKTPLPLLSLLAAARSLPLSLSCPPLQRDDY